MMYSSKKSNEAAAETTSTAPPASASSSPSVPRVGIQIGHWKTSELPDELWKLHWNYGAEDGQYTELETNTTIANLVASNLKAAGVTVDILPATIPEGYKADAFISIHADGSEDSSTSGYKITWSEFDTSGKSQKLSNIIEASYASATQLSADPNISSDMTEYYAFNRNKYTHSISAETPGVIIETGFITSSADRKIIVNKPELCAQAISDGIIEYLKDLKFTNWPNS